MATITASTLSTLLHLGSDLENDELEAIIDAAIDKLNVYLYRYGLEISSMSGTSGSKSWAGTSAEKGAIMTVASKIYSRDYVLSSSQSESVGLGPASYSVSSSASSSAGGGSVEESAKDLAVQLREVEVSYG
jgi:hypothetical protein